MKKPVNQGRVGLGRLLPALAILLPVTLHAAEWTGGAEGGATSGSGSATTRLRAWAVLDERPLSHSLYAELLDNEETSIELGYKPRYWFSEKYYGFGDVRLRFNTPTADQESLLLAGAGAQLIATRDRFAWLEAGAGYRLTSYDSSLGLEDDDEPLAMVRGGASQILSDLFKLDANASVFSASGWKQYETELGLSMRVPRGAVRVSYLLQKTRVRNLTTVDNGDVIVSFTVGF